MPPSHTERGFGAQLLTICPESHLTTVQTMPASENNGSLSWLEALYDREYPRLWRALLAWSGSRSIADDAAAEAFAQAAARTDLRDAAAWVWQVGFRLAGRELGRQRSLVRIEEAAEAEGGDRFTDRTGLSASTIDLLDALQQLTEQQRLSVILTDGFGLSSAHAAQILGTSAVTVRVQAMRARRRLHRDLSINEGNA